MKKQITKKSDRDDDIHPLDEFEKGFWGATPEIGDDVNYWDDSRGVEGNGRVIEMGDGTITVTDSISGKPITVYVNDIFVINKESSLNNMKKKSKSYGVAEAIKDAEKYYRETLRGKTVPDQEEFFTTAADFLCDETGLDWTECYDCVEEHALTGHLGKQSKSELDMGKETEKEHKDVYENIEKDIEEDNKLDMSFDEFTEDIAKDHLKEMPDYYTKLKEMEKQSMNDDSGCILTLVDKSGKETEEEYGSVSDALDYVSKLKDNKYLKYFIYDDNGNKVEKGQFSKQSIKKQSETQIICPECGSKNTERCEECHENIYHCNDCDWEWEQTTTKQSMKKISMTIGSKPFLYLKNLYDGFVVMGAGGDPNDWVNGITEILNSKGIIQASKPEDWLQEVFTISGNVMGSEGRTDLVFDFKSDAKVDIGKLAMWRIQFGDISWISDFVVNYADDYEMTSYSILNPKTGINEEIIVEPELDNILTFDEKIEEASETKCTEIDINQSRDQIKNQLLGEVHNCFPNRLTYDAIYETAVNTGVDKMDRYDLIGVLNSVALELGLPRIGWDAYFPSDEEVWTNNIQGIIGQPSYNQEPVDLDEIGELFDNSPDKLFVLDRILDERIKMFMNYDDIIDQSTEIVTKSMNSIKKKSCVPIKYYYQGIKEQEVDRAGRLISGKIHYSVRLRNSQNVKMERTIDLELPVKMAKVEQPRTFKYNKQEYPLDTYFINNLF